MFCGNSLYRPQPPRNPKLAPKHYVDGAAGKFILRSKEEQEQLMKAAYEASLFERELLKTSEAESRAAVEAGGAQIIDVDIAEFQQACQSVYDKYPEFADLIALIK